MAILCEDSLCLKKGGSEILNLSPQGSALTCEHFRTPLDVRDLSAKQTIGSMAKSRLGTGLMNAVGGLISGVAVAGMFNPWVSKVLC